MINRSRTKVIVWGLIAVAIVSATGWLIIRDRRRRLREAARLRNSWTLTVTKGTLTSEYLLDMRLSDDELTGQIDEALAPLFEEPVGGNYTAVLARTEQDPYDLVGRKTKRGHISSSTFTQTLTIGPYRLRKSEEAEGEYEVGQWADEDKWQCIAKSEDLDGIRLMATSDLLMRMKEDHRMLEELSEPHAED